MQARGKGYLPQCLDSLPTLDSEEKAACLHTVLTVNIKTVDIIHQDSTSNSIYEEGLRLPILTNHVALHTNSQSLRLSPHCEEVPLCIALKPHPSAMTINVESMRPEVVRSYALR